MAKLAETATGARVKMSTKSANCSIESVPVPITQPRSPNLCPLYSVMSPSSFGRSGRPQLGSSTGGGRRVGGSVGSGVVVGGSVGSGVGGSVSGSAVSGSAGREDAANS